MADYVRLFGRIHPHRGRVASIRTRVQVGVPSSAAVRVTDLQLQPGDHITGWTLHPTDLGVESVPGWSWRNAVASGDQTLVIAADTASASPTLWDVRGTATGVRLGRYVVGDVDGVARVDGALHAATQGAGVPPHLTARSDTDVDVRLGGRMLVCCWFRGLVVPALPAIEPPGLAHPDGPLLTAHPRWGKVLAAHDTWGEVIAAHPDWS